MGDLHRLDKINRSVYPIDTLAQSTPKLREYDLAGLQKLIFQLCKPMNYVNVMLFLCIHSYCNVLDEISRYRLIILRYQG